MAYAKRRDSNHKAVAADLRARGYEVTDIASAGDGIPDLVVTRGPHHRLVEVKRADRVHLKIAAASPEGVSRARQAAFRERHPGLVIVATSADQVDEVFRAL